METLPSLLTRIAASLRAHVSRYNESFLIERGSVKLSFREDTGDSCITLLDIAGARWRIELTALPVANIAGAVDIKVRFSLEHGSSSQTAVGIELALSSWSKQHYLLMPAAVYNGNRFDTYKVGYPPIFDESRCRVDLPITMTDVPRLEIDGGHSRIQLLTGDLSAPSVGVNDPFLATGFWLWTKQETALGQTGIEFEESVFRTAAVLRLTAPGMREGKKYFIGDRTRRDSTDRAVDFVVGDSAVIEARLHVFPAPFFQNFFSQWVAHRTDYLGKPELACELPLSAAFQILEEKQNRDNWDPDWRFYGIGDRASKGAWWQMGWIGGLMQTEALIIDGTEESRRRSLETFDFVFPGRTSPSGYFHGCWSPEDGDFGDGFHLPDSPRWHLVRKSADGLYFALKQFFLLREQDPAWQVPQAWEEGVRNCADAFLRTWDKYGQLGQFLDVNTGDIIVGGSTSGALTPAALALASVWFSEPRYLAAAEAIAEHYYFRDTQTGVTTGGPGEILQGADSESAYSLPESFITLYELTGKPFWLNCAEESAEQAATWNMPYNFRFPPDSTFGRLGILTAGSVFANVQNKHSAPAPCTCSGNFFLKLYRATGKPIYLELLRETVVNLPQYLSRDDKPISTLHSGWINERVNTSDWLEPVGEVFHGCCWPEVSLMLSCVEVPGLYVLTDSGEFTVFDHIIVSQLHEAAPDKLQLLLRNPTAYDATVRVLAERSSDRAQALGVVYPLRMHKVEVPAGGETVLELER